MDDKKPLSYQDVFEQLQTTPHLLIGNGFSIACNRIFQYESLYEKAIGKGLSEQAQKVFAARRTTNFEAIMRLLDETAEVARIYDLVSSKEESAIEKDNMFIKEILVNTIADSHINTPSEIPEDRLNHAADFLKQYDTIFTTNYDLLLEWVLKRSKAPSSHYDNFAAAQNGELDLVFLRSEQDRANVFYLHGALFLYFSDYKVYKQNWTEMDQSVRTLVQASIDSGKYPLCITEGSSEQKLRRITRNTYLSYALQKLRAIRKPLVIFGHSLGHGDDHILSAIADNRNIPAIYVGLHGDPNSARNHDTCDAAYRMAARRQEQIKTDEDEKYKLNVYFYQSETANPWGD